MLFFCYVGAIWAPPSGAKKILKGLQVGGMYGPMSAKLLTKSLHPFLRKNEPKQLEKIDFMCFWSF
jgi:hypothetical protein